MNATRLTRLLRAALLALLPVASLAVAPRAGAQVFAVGAGGGILNDEGSAESLKSFSTGAGYGFVEVALEPGLLMQARYTRMRLPASGANGPEIDVDAATLSIAYLFREDWWQGGFVLGGGGYWLGPRDPGPGQVVTDESTSRLGWNGGLLTIFSLGRNADVRLEAVGHLIRDENRRKPVVVSAAVAWRF